MTQENRKRIQNGLVDGAPDHKTDSGYARQWLGMGSSLLKRGFMIFTRILGSFVLISSVMWAARSAEASLPRCADKSVEICDRVESVQPKTKRSFDSIAQWAFQRLAKIASVEGIPETVKPLIGFYAEVMRKQASEETRSKALQAFERVRRYSADRWMIDCYEVNVLESKKPNAFNTGCQVFVTSAIVETLSEEELAAVFAHEISHGDQGHAVRNVGLLPRTAREHMWSLVKDEVTFLKTGQKGAVLKAVMEKGHLENLLRIYGEWGPKIEIEADLGAVSILERANISRAYLKSALVKIHQLAGIDVTIDANYEGVRDYPSLKTRLQAIDRW